MDKIAYPIQKYLKFIDIYHFQSDSIKNLNRFSHPQAQRLGIDVELETIFL